MSEDHAATPLRPLSAAALVAAALAFLLLVPAAHARTGSVSWASPTQADKSRLAVKVGSKLAFSLAATTSKADATVSIRPVGTLPAGAMLTSAPTGDGSRAAFRWTPAEEGEYTLRFSASTAAGASAPTLTYAVEVAPAVAEPVVHYPRSSTLTNDRSAQWAPVLKRVAVHSRPSSSARVVTVLGVAAADGAQSVVLVLDSLEKSATETWYRVRLPILPNNSTGWVSADALGELTTVHTHLYVDLEKLTATLMLDGRPIFKSIVGVGKPFWPTPKGQFYIRTKATNFGDPFFGPVAFGTSARSAVLTDWPAGGYVGVHGTSLPQLLPGRVSHGCVRMPNASIVKLAKLMPVGTPLTVR